MKKNPLFANGRKVKIINVGIPNLVGKIVGKVYNQDLYIVDCEGYTREHFKTKYSTNRELVCGSYLELV